MERGPRIIVADRSEPMQDWLAVAVTRAVGGAAEIQRASSGPEVLYHLAEHGHFDLVVTHAALPNIAAAPLLAMVRTAGLATPFVVLDYLPSASLRRLLARLGGVTLVDDPLDVAAVGAAARQLLRGSAVARPGRTSSEPPWSRPAPSSDAGDPVH